MVVDTCRMIVGAVYPIFIIGLIIMGVLSASAAKKYVLSVAVRGRILHSGVVDTRT